MLRLNRPAVAAPTSSVQQLESSVFWLETLDRRRDGEWHRQASLPELLPCRNHSAAARSSDNVANCEMIPELRINRSSRTLI